MNFDKFVKERIGVDDVNKDMLIIALLCRLGESVTLTQEELEDVQRGRYGFEWTTSLQDDTVTVQVI
jgi:hypothetical protein